MKIARHISLHRLVHAAAAVLAMPLLMGADGKGCASGGHVPVGTEVCGPRDCDGLGATGEAKLCADGSSLGRSVCATHDDGSCFWDFPACPASPDAGAPPPAGSACRSSGGTCVIGGGLGCPSRAPEAIDDCNPAPHNPGGAVCCLPATACTPANCIGPVPDDAKICDDGTALSRSVCVLNAAGSATCKWDFPACPTPNPGPQACQPRDCAGLDAQLDARVCDDGSTVGRTECSLNPGRDVAQVPVCGWNFPPCPGEDCAPAKCAGLPAPGDARLCADGSAVSRSRCTRTGPRDAAGGYVCAWSFPDCPAVGAPDAGTRATRDAQADDARTGCAPSSCVDTTQCPIATTCVEVQREGACVRNECCAGGIACAPCPVGYVAGQAKDARGCNTCACNAL